jgi:hypothetical protein
VLSLFSCFGPVRRFFVRGWQSIVNRSPNMWTLIGLGTGASFAAALKGHQALSTRSSQAFPTAVRVHPS